MKLLTDPCFVRRARFVANSWLPRLQAHLARGHVREVTSGATWMPLQSIKVSATPSQFIRSNCNAVAEYSIQFARLSPTCNRWPKVSNRAESRATTGSAPKRGLCDYSFKVAHYSFFDKRSLKIPCRQTAIHDDGFAGDVARHIGQQEQHHVGYLVGAACPTQRRLCADGLPKARVQ